MRGKLTVSLDAIQKNYQFLQAKAKNAICAAVVKADAYGLGAAPVAKALAQAGATHFFVALAEEGVALREAVPQARIHVLNGILPGEESLFIAHNLIPVLNDIDQVKLWNNGKPCALQIDTGLNRLGFNAGDFKKFDGLNVDFIMSHLACADTPENPINGLQRERFLKAVAIYPDVKKSLAASDGIFCGPDFHFDIVRPGAALYGLNPTAHEPNPMQPVIQLEVPILQIREVEQDGYVGYATTQSVTKGQRLATVSLGYADGFFRSLSNQGHLYHHGKALPVLGRVSMDVITVDITGHTLKPGDWLQVFGPDQTPDDLARNAGTIGYETLTNLGNRFDRVYIS